MNLLEAVHRNVYLELFDDETAMASFSGQLFVECLARPDRLGAGGSSTLADEDPSLERG